MAAPDVDLEALPQGRIPYLPDGWVRGGNRPGLYDMGLDESTVYSGSASAFISSKANATLVDGRQTFGTVCQTFYPKDYLDKRVRLSAYVRYDLEDSTSWCGIWLKTDLVTQGGEKHYLLDNMSDRKLVGNSRGEFLKCEIVVDTPLATSQLSFGFLLCGRGTVWADNFQFEIVDNNVPITIPKQNAPINLSFQVNA